MTEHEKFKEIIDLIGYNISKDFEYSPSNHRYEKIGYESSWGEEVIVDVREIIFTDWFIKCIYDYCDNTPWTWIMECDVRLMESKIMQNLHDPVSYLYYLIKQ